MCPIDISRSIKKIAACKFMQILGFIIVNFMYRFNSLFSFKLAPIIPLITKYS